MSSLLAFTLLTCQPVSQYVWSSLHICIWLVESYYTDQRVLLRCIYTSLHMVGRVIGKSERIILIHESNYQRHMP